MYVYIYIYLYKYAQLAHWLKVFIIVHWSVVESSRIHQQSDQNFYRYTTFRFILQFQ